MSDYKQTTDDGDRSDHNQLTSSSSYSRPPMKRLVYRAPPPPDSAAPVNRDVVDNVKKRIITMPKIERDFNIPKHLSPNKNKSSGSSSGNNNNNSRYDSNRDNNHTNDRQDNRNDYEDDYYYNDGDGDGGDDNYNNSKNNSNNNSNNNNGNNNNYNSNAYDDSNIDDSYNDYSNSDRVNTKYEDNYDKEYRPSRPSKAADAKQPYALTATNNAYNDDKMSSSNTNINKGKATTTTTFNFTPILKATYRELRKFVLSACDDGTLIKCYIERNRSGKNFITPFYSLCADLEDGTGRELVVCRKVFTSMSSHYVFSLKMEDLYVKREQRSKLYLGKLRALSASSYVLYDHGVYDGDSLSTGSASKGRSSNNGSGSGSGSGSSNKYNTSSSPGVDDSLLRRELAIIHFNNKKRPAPVGVRGMEICLPLFLLNQSPTAAAASSGSGSSSNTGTATTVGSIDSSSSSRAQAKLTTNADGDSDDDFNIDSKSSRGVVSSRMINDFSRIRASGKQNELLATKYYVGHERTSKYDPLSSCLVDFKGRANVASVKNFQLIESYPQDGPAPAMHDSERSFVLQLGKTTEDCFNMDFKHPLSLLQAFAICVARFDCGLAFN